MSDASAAAGGRTVDQVIDDNRLSFYQLAALVMCGTILFLDGFDIQTMSLAVPAMAADWGLERAAFSPALSASLWGILVASFVIGPIGDYVGRKPLALGALLLVAVSTLAVPFSQDMTQLTLWRFLTGVGLGAGMPNAYALSTELAPTRMRSPVLVAMASAVAAGALTAGFLAPWLMNEGGWEMVFYAGGVLPLIACAVLAVGLPESPRLLAARRWADPRIGRFLARIHPQGPVEIVPGVAGPTPKAPFVALFDRQFIGATLLLWASYTLVSFVLYLLISWLPSLLTGAGWPQGAALRGAVLIQLGGIIGGVAYAFYVTKGRPHYALIAAMLLAALSIGMFWVAPPTFLVWGAIMIALGAGVSGAMFALIAVAGGAYPAAMRATGLSWMVGVSRFAAAISPLVGGALLGMGMETVAVLSLLIVPIGVAALAAFLLPRAMPKGVA